MERKKNIALINLMFTLFCTLICTTSLLSQNSLYSKLIYKSFVCGDMKEWVRVIHEMELDESISFVKSFELLNYRYGYTAYLIGNNREQEASDQVRKAETQISSLLSNNPYNAELYAYRAAFLGFKIALSKFKAITLGPKSLKALKQGYSINPENPRVLLEKANSLYYTPSIFGGDKDEALKFYRKATFQFEKHGDTLQNWNYLNTMAMLANALVESGEKREARDLCTKILAIEPNFKWVRDKIAPLTK